MSEVTQLARGRRSLAYVTLVRLINPAVRSALLTVAGMALIATPVLLGVGATPLVIGVVAGAMTVALGLAGTDTEGRGTLSLTALASLDRLLGVGLVLIAAAFGVAGENEALTLFAAAGLAALLVTSVTRYSATPT